MGRARLGTIYRKANAKKWSGAFTHPVTGKRVLCTLYSDKQASRAALDRMIKETERCAEGLEDSCAAQRRRPIAEHIADYLEHGRRQQQAPRHIKCKEIQLRRFAGRARTLDDLTLKAAESVLQDLLNTGRSARTHNQHRATLVAFMNWAVETGRLGSHPFKKLPTRDERQDRRRRRRALTEDEIQRLLRVAQLRPVAEYGRTVLKRPGKDARGRRTWTRARLTPVEFDAAVERGRLALGKRSAVLARFERLGRQRALIYKTLVLTGLRKGELASLTVGDLNLDQRPPFVTLHPWADKSRRGADVPLRPDVADDIRSWLVARLAVLREAAVRGGETAPSRLPQRLRVFDVPSTLAHVLDLDLAAAGIPKRDERGYTIDVHALRHSFGSHLSKAGVYPRTAQAAMRHSSLHLTMNLYTDPKLLEVAAALDALPRLDALATPVSSGF